jgi:hypothetical protein
MYWYFKESNTGRWLKKNKKGGENKDQQRHRIFFEWTHIHQTPKIKKEEKKGGSPSL